MSRLLTSEDPAAFELLRPGGSSPYLLACDHASRTLPRKLGQLGVSGQELRRHIAWDIGIAGVARRLSELLDACLVLQNYSRLVIDANRPLRTPQSIVTFSEHTRVPSNEHLSEVEIAAREDEIFLPYHDSIRDQLDQREHAPQPPAICALHSFTPRYKGVERPWHAGVLYNRDARLSLFLLQALRRDPALVVGDNEPYKTSEETDYTVIVHGERRGIPYIELEIRQDLIAHEAGQVAWAERLATLLPEVYENALGTSAAL